MSRKLYKLLGPSGPYLSPKKGALGGHRKLKIYGRLDCPSALRYLAKGQYAAHRVFFATEADAIASGYRPCGVCMKSAYQAWKRSAGRNPDEPLRELQRRAAAGDQEAAARLAAHERRMLGAASFGPAEEAEPIQRLFERGYTRAISWLRDHGRYYGGWNIATSSDFAAMLRKVLRKARIPATVRVVSPGRRRRQSISGNFDVWVAVTPSVYLVAEEREATIHALRAAFPGCWGELSRFPGNVIIRAVDYYDPRPSMQRAALECRVVEPLAGMLAEEIFQHATGGAAKPRVRRNSDEGLRRLRRAAAVGDTEAAQRLEAAVRRVPQRRPEPITLYDLIELGRSRSPEVTDSYISIALAELWGTERGTDVDYRHGKWLTLEGKEADWIIEHFKLAGHWKHPDPEDAVWRSWFVVDTKRTPVSFRDAQELMRLLNLKYW